MIVADPHCRLRSASSSVSGSVACAIITNLDVHGPVVIKAPDVTLMNSRVRNAGIDVVRIEPGVSGFMIQDCEIDGVGTGNDGSNGIRGSGTFLRNDTSMSRTASRLMTALNSGQFHFRSAGVPQPLLQRHSNRRKRLKRLNQPQHGHGQTAAVTNDNYFGPISNIQVENNRLVGGGITVSDGQMTPEIPESVS